MSSTLLRSLAEIRGTCFSLYFPTHRHGNETLSDSSRFRNLLNVASTEFADTGITVSEIRDLLEPIESLVSPTNFWQNRTEGLAIFSSKDFFQFLSLPYAVSGYFRVAPHFCLRQSVPYLTSDSRFFVLALSKNHVRLFRGDHESLTPVSIPGGPSSMEQALRFEDPERQLQMRSVGGGNLSFHGHGAGEELDKESLERYFRLVDTAVTKALHRETAPLVLAAVPYYLPLYSSISSYPNVFDEVIEGNADHLGERDLHRLAHGLLGSHFASERSIRARRLTDLLGTGLVTDDLDAVVQAAIGGRVQTLFLFSSGPSDDLDEEDMVNRAIAETSIHGGSVEMYQDAATSTVPTRALLRY